MSMRQLPLNIDLRDEASFDSFVAETEAAAIALHQIQMAIVKRQHGVWYFHGEPGAGRSHILQAACRFAQQWDRPCLYLPLADEEVRAIPDLLKGLNQLDVICVDDVDKVLDSPHWQQALADLILQAEASAQVVLLAGRLALAQWPVQADRRLISALVSVVPVELQPLKAEETLSLALQRHAAARGLQLPGNVVRFLIREVGASLPQLLAVLRVVEQASLIEKRRITLPFVKKVLE